MKVYYSHKFHQWCAEENDGKYSKAAWGDTEQEAIDRFNSIK